VTVQHVTEFPATAPEQIDFFAKLLSRSQQKRDVFVEVYRGQQKRPKTAEEIGWRIGLSAKRVLEIAGPLAAHKLFEQVKIKGRPIGYRKYAHINAVKTQILRLATDRKKLAKHVTVRKPVATVTVRLVQDQRRTGSVFVDARHITIDDIDNFRRVRAYKPGRLPKKLPTPLPESAFKAGVARILGNRGSFKDWGGERNDLYTTRLAIKGKRCPTAMGFKGPAVRPPLTPGKMGKNGDQIQRLFTSPARVFLVQFEGEIAETVPEQLQQLAIAKSAELHQPVWYGAIGREDSARLRIKYKDKFSVGA